MAVRLNAVCQKKWRQMETRYWPQVHEACNVILQMNNLVAGIARTHNMRLTENAAGKNVLIFEESGVRHLGNTLKRYHQCFGTPLT